MPGIRTVGLLVLAAAATWLSGCAATGRPTPPDAAARTGEFTYHLHQVFVPVSINGVDVGLALIDTGATACALDEDVARRLAIPEGRPSTVIGTAGEMRVRTVTLDRVAVFGAEAPGVDATVYPLTGTITPDGRPLAMIIGYTFLRHFAVEFDYVDRRLVLHAEPVHAERSAPLSVEDRIPRIWLTLNDGLRVPFRIDTGASLFETDDTYLNISPSVADRLAAAGQDMEPVFTLSGTGVGGQLVLPVVRLDSADLLGTTLDRPHAIVQPAVGVFSDPDIPGFVGNYTLEQLGVVVIDYLDGTIDLPRRTCR